MTIFAFNALILYIHNFFKFLIKRKKYKQMPQVVFYTVAFLSIIFNILIAWIGFSCDGLKFFINLAVPYLTLVIGNYLAGNIWILSIQLE